MWERLSFYGMRALLVLFIASTLFWAGYEQTGSCRRALSARAWACGP
jgi:dipeptide/tripeptide permease